jgi:hypothetical protein
VPSVPCFELWLLLHFADIQAYFPAGEIIQKLVNYIANYGKGATGIYARTEPLLSVAIARAIRLKNMFQPATGTDPYTDVDTVVTLLQGIRTATTASRSQRLR